MNHLPLAQVAAQLGVCRQTIRNLIHAGKLHAVKIGKNWKIPAAELERLSIEGTNATPAA